MDLDTCGYREDGDCSGSVRQYAQPRLKAAGQRGRALRPGGSAAAGGGREGSGAGDRLGAWLFDALLRWHRGFLDSLFELVAFVAEQRGKDRSLSR